MSPGGRTVWWAKDSAWWRREAIVELGEEFGSAGPAVVDWLACEAKAQNDGGWVKAGYRTLARGTFGDTTAMSPIVHRSVELGLLDDFSEDGRTFTCRISGWADEQHRARATTKKAAQRAANGGVEPKDTTGQNGTADRCPPVSPLVPECPPTGQDRTGVKEEEGDARAAAGLHPQLDDALAAFRAAPGLEVEPLAINAAMMSRSDVDVMAAAGMVAAWAHEGGLRVTSASRLMFTAIAKLAEQAARQDGVRTASADREGRRTPSRPRGGATAADFLAIANEEDAA